VLLSVVQTRVALESIRLPTCVMRLIVWVAIRRAESPSYCPTPGRNRRRGAPLALVTLSSPGWPTLRPNWVQSVTPGVAPSPALR
jgi:hypothetical protein